MQRVRVATFSELDPARPHAALVANVDLVVVRWPDEDEVSVLYGRCLHRGALLADGAELARRSALGTMERLLDSLPPHVAQQIRSGGNRGPLSRDEMQRMMPPGYSL